MKLARLAALAIGALTVASHVAAAPREVLPWVEDYARAVAQARANDVPLFVEAWAPW